MANYKAIGGSVIGLAMIVLIVALNYNVTPDTYYCANEPDKLMECMSVSAGLQSRCYLNKEKSSWDYCKGGWVKVLDHIEAVSNIQECNTKYWNVSKNIYVDCIKNYTTTELFDCMDEKDNSTCKSKEIIEYYNSTCFDKIEITQYNRVICEDTGEVNVHGEIISYKDSFCRVHENEIHCDLYKDSNGGGADSNGDGQCQSGEDDCQIIKINEDESLENIKESRSELEAIR